jgi:hypothetical protein
MHLSENIIRTNLEAGDGLKDFKSAANPGGAFIDAVTLSSGLPGYT